MLPAYVSVSPIKEEISTCVSVYNCHDSPKNNDSQFYNYSIYKTVLAILILLIPIINKAGTYHLTREQNLLINCILSLASAQTWNSYTKSSFEA